MAASESGEAFGRRVDGWVKGGVVSVGLALGHRLGLFEALAGQEHPVTARQLGDLTGCRENFLKEWLLMMAAADVVTLADSEGRQFLLPAERRAALTSPPHATFTTAKYIPLFLGHCGALEKCFRKDGPPGLGWGEVGDIWGEWQEDRERHFRAYLPACLAQLPGMTRKLEEGARVLDIGTNDGRLVQMLASQFPRSTFLGTDINKTAIAAIKDVPGQDNASFQVQDALDLPAAWTDTFDYVTIVDAFQHLPDTVQAAREVRRVLRPGGYVSIVEIPRDVNYAADVRLPNAVVNYMFQLMWCGEEGGEGHDHVGQGHGGHDHGGQGHGGHDHGQYDCGTGQKRDSEGAPKVAEDKEFYGVTNGIQRLKGSLSRAGFTEVHVDELPKVDIDDNVHIFCSK